MGAVIVITIIAIASILLFMSNNKPEIPEITKANSVKDIVMSINHGRIYPFYTRMNLERVKEAVRKLDIDTTDFDNSVHLQKLMGRVRGVHIPIPHNALVSDVYCSFNQNQVVSSITINISKLDFATLVEQMLTKFGDPISVNSQLMVWRESYMTISLDSVNKYINVMDERLPSR